jgi:oligopeptide transport system ATP-binding protein
MTAETQAPLLVEVKDLVNHFRVGSKGIAFGLLSNMATVQAVDGVSLTIYEGETLGLVGESGCGKSTLGYTVLMLLRPTSGKVFYRGDDITVLSKKDLRPYRKEMQIIFQDPQSALDPRMTIGQAIAEPLRVHRVVPPNQVGQRVEELLNVVGLKPHFKNRYPHEFSGGQQQRIIIARALSVHPKFIVADEPISALDVSIQAQVVNLLEELQEKFDLTYLFISHDLRIVRHISDRVAVMYLGKVVELCDSNDLYQDALHPYSKALLSAVPSPDPLMAQSKRRIILKGDVPSPINPPSGCRFRTRCPIAQPLCAEVEPPLIELRPRHSVACHFALAPINQPAIPVA